MLLEHRRIGLNPSLTLVPLHKESENTRTVRGTFVRAEVEEVHKYFPALGILP